MSAIGNKSSPTKLKSSDSLRPPRGGSGHRPGVEPGWIVFNQGVRFRLLAAISSIGFDPGSEFGFEEPRTLLRLTDADADTQKVNRLKPSSA